MACAGSSTHCRFHARLIVPHFEVFLHVAFDRLTGNAHGAADLDPRQHAPVQQSSNRALANTELPSGFSQIPQQGI